MFGLNSDYPSNKFYIRDSHKVATSILLSYSCEQNYDMPERLELERPSSQDISCGDFSTLTASQNPNRDLVSVNTRGMVNLS